MNCIRNFPTLFPSLLFEDLHDLSYPSQTPTLRPHPPSTQLAGTLLSYVDHS